MTEGELYITFVTVFCPGGYTTKFYTGRLRPEAQPLLFDIPILDRKGTAFGSAHAH